MTAGFPTVPDTLLEGWEQLEREVDRPFDTKIASVEARTVVYEDRELRERLQRRLERDRLWRFFIASSLRLRPLVSPTEPLTRLITRRAQAGFAERLEARGFDGVRAAERRELTIAGTQARVRWYDAVCRIPGLSMRVRGAASIRPASDVYLLAGGAYPTEVRDAEDAETGDTLQQALDPKEFKAELLDLVKAADITPGD